MRKASLLIAFWVAGLGGAGLAGPALARTPVIVELFTSQGCSSCVASGQVIADLADKPHVLPLTFPVDYWDYLGWRDTFAKPEFSDRQRAYQKALGLRDVYTPQLVVDGAAHTGRKAADKADELIKAAARAHQSAPDM